MRSGPRASNEMLFDIRMNDGSRNFADLPEEASFGSMRNHLTILDGAAEMGFVTDDVTEMWLDFRYRDHSFSVNNQMGDYWFFVEDPLCPEAVLRSVVEHFAIINPR